MSETALLVAVRDQIREICGYKPHECNIEYDEVPPAIAGEVYVVVMPGGWQPGENNAKGGGVLDEIYSVDVSVIMRATRIPRDKTRDLYLDLLDGLNVRVKAIRAAVHFNLEVMAAANENLEDSSALPFIETLKFSGMDRRPRLVGAEVFGDKPGERRAGLARTINFSGARRIQYSSDPK